jgi:hypothetical protein
MRSGIQSFLLSAGEAACYALDIIQIAERELGGELDPIAALEDGIEHGYIRYRWDDPRHPDNWYVDFPASFLALLIGEEWSVSKEGPDYRPRPGEHVVQRWERQTTAGTIGHFRLPDWDSLVDSRTVRDGRVVSTRVFRRAA